MANESANEKTSAPVRRSGGERKHVPGVILPYLAREFACLLSDGEWKLWSVLYLHSNREGYTFLANNTLCREAGCGLKAAQGRKRGLMRKGWLENCGQRKGWMSNTYKVGIPTPKAVHAFLDYLWEQLNKEPWWSNLGRDGHNYAEDHLDWLIAWRAACVLKTHGWKAKEKSISEKLQAVAAEELLSILRLAGVELGENRGLWWLLGDGFDEAVKKKTPESRRPTPVSRNDPGG